MACPIFCTSWVTNISAAFEGSSFLVPSLVLVLERFRLQPGRGEPRPGWRTRLVSCHREMREDDSHCIPASRLRGAPRVAQGKWHLHLLHDRWLVSGERHRDYVRWKIPSATDLPNVCAMAACHENELNSEILRIQIPQRGQETRPAIDPAPPARWNQQSRISGSVGSGLRVFQRAMYSGR